MIDIAKMEAAWENQPLCQKKWGEDLLMAGAPVCAVTALLMYAGVRRDEIHWWQYLDTGHWFATRGVPVLEKAYHIPAGIATRLVSMFDHARTPAKGLKAILTVCHRYNHSYGEFERWVAAKHETTVTAYDEVLIEAEVMAEAGI